MEDMISCRNLTRRFGEFTAVNGLNLEVAAGAICAFLGPNGAGKSTTVKMMTGLLAPTSGDVIVCGLNAAANPLELKRRIGVLPEDLGLFDDLTVEEHLLLTGDIYGITRQETKARASQLLHALSLEHGRRTFAASCSHGMRKKTAFAMSSGATWSRLRSLAVKWWLMLARYPTSTSRPFEISRCTFRLY